MEITLIRHTSVGVPKGTCYGWSDVPVAETFEQEAAETRRQLQEIINEQGNFDVVFSSPLSRARKLAAFCGYPDAILDDRLKEMNMGAWEMRRYEDIEHEDPHIQEWYQDYLNLAATDGEGFPQLYQRVAGFLKELTSKTDPKKRVAIFAHGGVLACAAIYARQYKPEEAYRHLTPYGGIIRLNIKNRVIRKSTLQDIPILMLLADEARGIMRKNGNMNQWINGYPTEEVFRRDIINGHSYLIEDEGEPTGTFAFIPSPEPTYSQIYQGKWIDEDNPYYVIHRIASKAEARGIMKDMLGYCFRQTRNIRIDTHRHNLIMRHLLQKNGFLYCGIIYLESGDERLAYQKVLV